MVRHGRGIDVCRACSGDPDYRGDCLFHLPRLPASVETRAALGLYRGRVDSHLTGAVDTNQSSLVHHAVFNDGGLGYARQRRTCTAVASRAAHSRGGGRCGGDGDPNPRSVCHARCRDCLLKFAAVSRGVDGISARERPDPNIARRVFNWARRAGGRIRRCRTVYSEAIYVHRSRTVWVRG